MKLPELPDPFEFTAWLIIIGTSALTALFAAGCFRLIVFLLTGHFFP